MDLDRRNMRDVKGEDEGDGRDKGVLDRINKINGIGEGRQTKLRN